MLNMLTNSYVTVTELTTMYSISFINNLPVALYLSAIFFTITLVLTNATSVRVNTTIPAFRSKINTSLIYLFKL